MTPPTLDHGARVQVGPKRNDRALQVADLPPILWRLPTPPHPFGSLGRLLDVKTIMVRYETKADQVETNAALVRAVYAALAEVRPPGFRYATYRVSDGTSFVHVATLDDGAANPLPGLPAFRAFQEGIAARCVQPPQVTELTQVGAYSP